jgi:hypothetical protein
MRLLRDVHGDGDVGLRDLRPLQGHPGGWRAEGSEAVTCSTPGCFSKVRGWTNLSKENKPQVVLALCATCVYQAARLGGKTHQLKGE